MPMMESAQNFSTSSILGCLHPNKQDNASCDKKLLIFSLFAVLETFCLILHIPKLGIQLKQNYSITTRTWLVELNTCLVNVLLTVLYLPLQLVLVYGMFTYHCHHLCSTMAVIERTMFTTYLWSTTLSIIIQYNNLKKQSQVRLKNSERTNQQTDITIMAYPSNLKRNPSVKVLIAYITGIWIFSALVGGFSSMVTSHQDDFGNKLGSCYCHLTLDFHGIYHLLYSAFHLTIAFIVPIVIQLVLTGLCLRTALSTDDEQGQHSTVDASATLSTVDEPSKNPFVILEHPCNELSIRSRRELESNVQGLNAVEQESLIGILLKPMLLILFTGPYFIVQASLGFGYIALHPYPHCLYMGTVLMLSLHSVIKPLFLSARILVAKAKQLICDKDSTLIYRGQSSTSYNMKDTAMGIRVLSTTSLEECNINSSGDTENLLRD